MIKTTKGKMIGKLLEGSSAKGFPPDLIRRAERKIALLDAAHCLDDLRLPPSNNLEKLVGDRKGKYSIRVSMQWRICFDWIGNDAFDVEIIDYH